MRDSFQNLGARSLLELGFLETPAFVIDEKRLRENAELLRDVGRRTGAKILLAQKAFSNYDLYPLLAKYLDGTEASGLFEARLGWEEWRGGEVHVFSAAYRERDFGELLRYADHVIFNSVSQLERHGPRAKRAGKSVGLRINPECSTQNWVELYDPCASGSRLGVTKEQWDAHMTPELLSMLDGLHFHTLCEQDADALEKTLAAVEERFGNVLPRMKWVNFGGGHHITRPGYDVALLERLVTAFREKYGVQVYLEPGEAVALDAGYLVTEVLDIVHNGVDIAIVDASAACHMPDVLEAQYLPPLYRSMEDGAYRYRLAGPTCLAGDVIGDYRFDEPLQAGDKLVFGDMAIYTTCKTNTFNGTPLPDIYVLTQDGKAERLTHFHYGDFKHRLGSRGGL